MIRLSLNPQGNVSIETGEGVMVVAMFEQRGEAASDRPRSQATQDAAVRRPAPPLRLVVGGRS